jgi:hypothetical protein
MWGKFSLHAEALVCVDIPHTVMPHRRHTHTVGSGPVANVKTTLALMPAGLRMTLRTF